MPTVKLLQDCAGEESISIAREDSLQSAEIAMVGKLPKE